MCVCSIQTYDDIHDLIDSSTNGPLTIDIFHIWSLTFNSTTFSPGIKMFLDLDFLQTIWYMDIKCNFSLVSSIPIGKKARQSTLNNYQIPSNKHIFPFLSSTLAPPLVPSLLPALTKPIGYTSTLSFQFLNYQNSLVSQRRWSQPSTGAKYPFVWFLAYRFLDWLCLIFAVFYQYNEEHRQQFKLIFPLNSKKSLLRVHPFPLIVVTEIRGQINFKRGRMT